MYFDAKARLPMRLLAMRRRRCGDCSGERLQEYRATP
jgi:hypothetical protein